MVLVCASIPRDYQAVLIITSAMCVLNGFTASTRIVKAAKSAIELFDFPAERGDACLGTVP